MANTNTMRIKIGGHYHALYEAALGITLKRGDTHYHGTAEQFRGMLATFEGMRPNAERSSLGYLTREINKLNKALGL